MEDSARLSGILRPWDVPDHQARKDDLMSQMGFDANVCSAGGG